VTKSARDIADAFLNARGAATALPDFPGELPANLNSAYAVQEQAIAKRAGDIAGWKIGRIPNDYTAKLGGDRLTGPIFRDLVWPMNGAQEISIPAYSGGFAAVEAEFVFRIGANAPAGKTRWLREEAADLVAALHVGVELAGSPLASINELGPLAVICDFGNNHGLILGPEIPDWQSRDDEELTAETYIDGELIGRGGAASVLGGPMGSLLFLLEHLAERGRPVRAGELISTGATTGIHDIVAGQHARVSFGAYGEILCAAKRAAPLVGALA
jgi:2-keto-4-pentenoate hydratase